VFSKNSSSNLSGFFQMNRADSGNREMYELVLASHRPVEHFQFFTIVCRGQQFSIRRETNDIHGTIVAL
jgi:hypothetical protein